MNPDRVQRHMWLSSARMMANLAAFFAFLVTHLSLWAVSSLLIPDSATWKASASRAFTWIAIGVAAIAWVSAYREMRTRIRAAMAPDGSVR